MILIDTLIYIVLLFIKNFFTIVKDNIFNTWYLIIFYRDRIYFKYKKENFER